MPAPGRYRPVLSQLGLNALIILSYKKFGVNVPLVGKPLVFNSRFNYKMASSRPSLEAGRRFVTFAQAIYSLL